MNLKKLPLIFNISTVTVLFGIVLLCFIWGGFYVKVQNEKRSALDIAVKETGNYTRTFSEHTSRTLRGLDEITLFLKYRAEKEGMEIDLPSFVKENWVEGQPFVLLSVQNENGEVVSSSRAPFVSANHGGREHFEVHRAVDTKTLFISKPVVGRVSNEWKIHLTRRINKADGSFGGIVVADVDPGYFAEFYKQIDLGEQSVIALIGLDGILRVRQSAGEVSLGLDWSKNEIMKKAEVSQAGNRL